MRNLSNRCFSFPTLIDRRRHHHNQRRQLYKRLFGVASRFHWQQKIENWNHGRYFTMYSTRESVLSSPYGIQSCFSAQGHPHLAQSIVPLHSPLRFSSTVSENEADSWNSRVKEFLRLTPAPSQMTPSALENYSDTNQDIEQRPLEKISPDKVANLLQSLLDELLEITAAAMVVQKGESQKDMAYDTQTQHDNENYNQYIDWIPLSKYVTSSKDNMSPISEMASQNGINKEIDVGLAFALMDRLVALELTDDAVLINHTLEWTGHTTCLNPILQLWRQSCSVSRNVGSKVQRASASVLTPSEVLAKLDTYRQHSNLLIPDVQSYNIILDAVATQKGPLRRKTMNSGSIQAESVVDIGFCRSLWEWMWKESIQDSLIRPDEITLRIMLKANVFTGHALAAQRCEALVDEWAGYNYDHHNKDEHQHKIHDPRGTLLQSLVHVWALNDPQIAESYLKELARRYLAGKVQNPPDTIAWNRVISAYAIAYDQPGKALQVLDDFWEFYRQAHGLDDKMASKAEPLADSSVNTRSNSLKLSNAIAISGTIEESGITDNLSSAVDSAIWKVHQPNLETYNSLLEGFARQNNVQEANKIFESVKNAASTSPDIATYTSAIKANRNDLEKVNDIVQQCLAAYEAQEEQRRSGGMEDDMKISNHIKLDRPFFHAWLHACASTKNIKEAKKVMKQMRALKFAPNATTYKMLIEVFLSTGNSQGAIEWLLAYAKLEGMSESAIVSCTTLLLNWYRNHGQNSRSGDVDSMVLLQILCESGFVTEEEPLQQLLLGVSPSQATAIMGWLRRKKDGTSLKMWAIVMQALAQQGLDAQEVESFFRQLIDEPSWVEKFNQDNSSKFDDEEEKLVVEMYSSMVVAWSKQGKLNRKIKQRIQHWTNELGKYRDGALSLNLAAQVALVMMYCEAGDPLSSEQYVHDLFRDYEEGRIASPPDTIMCNMVLNAWAKKKNGTRAATFLEESIEEPDVISYNTVINAFARQGQLEKAEEWAYKLIDSFIENPIESKRPQQGTFTVLLAAWRRSKQPNAAERAETILQQMHQLYDNNILLSKPNLKSYQTVLDTWEKSSRSDAAKKAEELLSSSSEYSTNKKLLKKVRYIKSRHKKRSYQLNEENRQQSRAPVR